MLNSRLWMLLASLNRSSTVMLPSDSGNKGKRQQSWRTPPKQKTRGTMRERRTKYPEHKEARPWGRNGRLKLDGYFLEVNGINRLTNAKGKRQVKTETEYVMSISLHDRSFLIFRVTRISRFGCSEMVCRLGQTQSYCLPTFDPSVVYTACVIQRDERYCKL